MTTYVLRNGKIVPKYRANNSAVHHAISDDLGQDLEHHGYSDGRRTASKSQFRRWTREAGLVEKGNDRSKSDRFIGTSTQDMVRDIAEATNMVKNGYVPQIKLREGE